MTFVDSHVHFWDQSELPYPWLIDVPAIAGRHTPMELQRESAPDVPTQMVFVECGAPWPDEIHWVEQLAVREPRIAAIVAKVLMNVGAATTEAIAELARHPLVRGVRHLIQDESDPLYCLSKEFVAGVHQLGAANLSFDICCRQGQLPAVLELVRRCPDTHFILDHCGKPNIVAGRLDPWRERIVALAALRNIDCKFSGLVTEASHSSWTIEQLRPYAEHVLATFGASRVLFGSDWPMVKLAGGYARWLDTARELTWYLGAIEQQAIFVNNARRVYRLA